MKELVEQMYWHPKGVVVALPPESTVKIASSVIDNRPMPIEEQMRLRVMEGDPILAKRYPDIKTGDCFMNQVNRQWREQLYDFAERMTAKIVDESTKIGKTITQISNNGEIEEIANVAVVLFGSTARLLTKARHSPDPSNIDLSVIGYFNDEERNELFDRIRQYRKLSEPVLGNNIGVHIQTPDKLYKCRFDAALVLIGASGRALYDRTGIWRDVESRALRTVYDLYTKTKDREDRRRYNHMAWDICRGDRNRFNSFFDTTDTSDIQASDGTKQLELFKPANYRISPRLDQLTSMRVA